MSGWVYMMTNRPFGTLYGGVTNDIVRRGGHDERNIGELVLACHGRAKAQS
ncbi:MAG: hypothetical protein QOH05_3508 [Acetobacteraceae bacterium]|jgi:predicted GIY-YIG superfamily endonuclease|nr:hypothetical protein [Acetobacteraceae bacterium]